MTKSRWEFWKFWRKREGAEDALSVHVAMGRPTSEKVRIPVASSSSIKGVAAPFSPKKRRIHLGIDFGTSTSKIVFRDYGAPGGERAVLLLRKGAFRIPSRVCIASSELLFASETTPDHSEVYDSIKMQAAAEGSGNRHYYFGPARTWPTKDGFTAVDLATLAIWFMISEGHRAVATYLGGSLEGVSLGMTMGVPMAFFTDLTLRPVFLSMARQAWHLYREKGPVGSVLSIKEAKDAIREASDAQLPEIAEDQVRDWIRSEGEAAMWWPFQSPAIPAGRYAKLDIGAGTSHASLFQIFGDNVTPKTGIAFSGAFAVSVGMDAVDGALAKCMGLNGDSLTLRGREQALLQGDRNAQAAISEIREQIYGSYRKAWIQTFRKIEASPAERQAWQDHKMFSIGGGSLVEVLVDPMHIHPATRDRIRPAFLEPPPDFIQMDGKAISRTELLFASVAYGLSNIGLSIPEAFTPAEVPTMPQFGERRVCLDRDDIYAKQSRLPVILPRKDYGRRIDSYPTQPPVDLLRPYPAEGTKAWKVSQRVGNVRNNAPDLFEESCG